AGSASRTSISSMSDVSAAQHRHPLPNEIIESTRPATLIASMSMLPKSLTITPIRVPRADFSRWLSSVVLPAPRKPVTRTTGITRPNLPSSDDVDVRHLPDVPAAPPVAGHDQRWELQHRAVVPGGEDGGARAELGVQLGPGQTHAVPVLAFDHDEERQVVHLGFVPHVQPDVGEQVVHHHAVNLVHAVTFVGDV